jgi:hypothetical protein
VVAGGEATEPDGKTESRRRTISLDTITVGYLRRHLTVLDSERNAFGTGYRDSGKLICILTAGQSIPTLLPGGSTG